MRKGKRWGIVLATIITIILGILGIAQDPPQLRYVWTAPTSGSPAVTYDAQWEVDGVLQTFTDIPETTMVLPWPEAASARLRVAGVDSLGRMGPWSEWSETFTDEGQPSDPGRPRWVGVE